MKHNAAYKDEKVDESERFGRIVLTPRDIDPVTNYPKDSFIGLRHGESGISFLLVTDAEVLDIIDDLFHYLKYIKA